MIWSVSSSVNAFDPTLEDAAQSLGAEEIQTFRYVTLPALMPGIISGSLLMFMLALNRFVVSLIITTTATETLPVAIYGAIRGNISPQIAAVSSVYVIIAVVAIVVADRLVGLDRFLHPERRDGFVGSGQNRPARPVDEGTNPSPQAYPPGPDGSKSRYLLSERSAGTERTPRGRPAPSRGSRRPRPGSW